MVMQVTNRGLGVVPKSTQRYWKKGVFLDKIEEEELDQLKALVHGCGYTMVA